MKPLLLMFLVFISSISCADDNEFHSLLGSWADIPSSGIRVLESSASKPPPANGCSEKITVTFNENLTGSLTLKEINCDDPKQISDDFSWSIKVDVLRINFDSTIDNDWDLKAGINTFSISGDTLSITNENGSNVVLIREQTAAM